MAVTSKTEDLEILLAVIDSGSFSAAARVLNQQVAKVSRSVSRLESALNCTLLNRTTRRLELTEEGHSFIRYVREGLNTLERGEEALRLLKQAPAGRLRVDAASPFIFHQITPLIADFTEAYPEIHLDITSHDDIIDLLEHKTDVAIRIGELKDSNLHARLLGRSHLHLVASPDYLSNAPELTSVNSLPSHKLIGFTDSHALNVWPLTKEQKLRFSITASSGETVRQLCLQGQGIALLSYFMCKQDIDEGRLVEVLAGNVTSPNRREPVQAVYYRNSAVSSRILAFLDFIQPQLTL